MLAGPELQDYLDEIRREVCSRCVERPPDGPPCGPLGKACGIEMHLPQLVDAVHEVHSDLIAPYLDNNRCKICAGCAFLHSSICPCPMDYLAVLVVQAVEAVDRRRDRCLGIGEPPADLPGPEDLARAYEEAARTWTGCDWPTSFGPARLDLQNWTAAAARDRASHSPDATEKECWTAAAHWLAEVERKAKQAEGQAALAVAAAKDGKWQQATSFACRAWALEFVTGRPLRHYPPTWQRLYEVIEAVAHREMPAAVEVG
jgi:hypothetical protein